MASDRPLFSGLHAGKEVASRGNKFQWPLIGRSSLASTRCKFLRPSHHVSMASDRPLFSGLNSTPLYAIQPLMFQWPLIGRSSLADGVLEVKYF